MLVNAVLKIIYVVHVKETVTLILIVKKAWFVLIVMGMKLSLVVVEREVIEICTGKIFVFLHRLLYQHLQNLQRHQHQRIVSTLKTDSDLMTVVDSKLQEVVNGLEIRAQSKGALLMV
jgi:hypothetical protein